MFFFFFFNLGIGTFSWSLKKQQVIALSTIEAEYITIISATCQAIWLRKMLSELKYEQKILQRSSVIISLLLH